MIVTHIISLTQIQALVLKDAAMEVCHPLPNTISGNPQHKIQHTKTEKDKNSKPHLCLLQPSKL